MFLRDGIRATRDRRGPVRSERSKATFSSLGSDQRTEAQRGTARAYRVLPSSPMTRRTDRSAHAPRAHEEGSDGSVALRKDRYSEKTPNFAIHSDSSWVARRSDSLVPRDPRRLRPRKATQGRLAGVSGTSFPASPNATTLAPEITEWSVVPKATATAVDLQSQRQCRASVVGKAPQTFSVTENSPNELNVRCHRLDLCFTGYGVPFTHALGQLSGLVIGFTMGRHEPIYPSHRHFMNSRASRVLTITR